MSQFFTTIQLYKKEKGFKSTLMILPPAWIENSIETYIYQHTTKSQVIYWVVLVTIVLTFILLPFVYVDISIQSNGVVRPAIEKTDIKARISGKINDVYVYEGQKVKKGNILLRFRASSSHEKSLSRQSVKRF